MTKKDYILLANIINDIFKQGTFATKEQTIQELIKHLQKDNAKFKDNLFLKACYK